MDEIIKETKEYIDKIKKTDIYMNYIKSKENIDSKPKLKEKLDDFRRNSFEIQLSCNYGQYNCYEQILNLKNVNDELLNNFFVKEFMEDELKISKLIREIFNTIIEELDFNADFLE